MPPGRPLNHDAKIARLIAELRKALIVREAARIEGAVASHIDGLVASLHSGIDIGGARQTSLTTRAVSAVGSRATTAAKPKGRKRRSAASRRLQAARMKEYWAKRKAAESKGDAASKGKKGATPAK